MYSPTSGTGVYNAIGLIGGVNQTGGANGITRGILVNQTITAAADYRAIQVTNNTGLGFYASGTADNKFLGHLVIDSDTKGLELGDDQDMLLYSDGAGVLYVKPLAADTDTTLNFFGTTNSGQFKWMEDEDYFQFNDDILMTGGENIILDTSTGTKIGTATNQLLGFYGATPVDQPATVSDAATQDLTGGDTVDQTKLETDLTSCKNSINAIIDRLQELGLIA